MDAAAVPLFEDELKKATSQSVKRIVLMLENLKCISSAGLRSLIFNK
nr:MULTISPECIES: hypothetical protein [Fischerella]